MTDVAETAVSVEDAADPLGAMVGKKRGRRLANIAGVKSCLAHVIREVEGDRMDAGKARVMVYALSTFAGVLQAHDLEQRLAALENRT